MQNCCASWSLKRWLSPGHWHLISSWLVRHINHMCTTHNYGGKKKKPNCEILGGAKHSLEPQQRTAGTGKGNGSAESKRPDHWSQQGPGPGDGQANGKGHRSAEKADRLLQRPRWTEGWGESWPSLWLFQIFHGAQFCTLFQWNVNKLSEVTDCQLR